MKQSIPGKIGRIKFKSGGGELRVLPRGKHERRDHAVASLRDNVEWIEKEFDEDIAGFAIVVWDHDMRRADMSFIGRNSPISSWSMPYFVFANLLDRRTEDMVNDAVSRWLSNGD